MPIDPTLPYDDGNIFARILRGEIPNDTVAQNDHALAFRDIRPQAPVHVLVIPKGRYVSLDDFAANAPDAEIVAFNRLVAEVARSEGLSLADGGDGFRFRSRSFRRTRAHRSFRSVRPRHGRCLPAWPESLRARAAASS